MSIKIKTGRMNDNATASTRVVADESSNADIQLGDQYGNSDHQIELINVRSESLIELEKFKISQKRSQNPELDEALSYISTYLEKPTPPTPSDQQKKSLEKLSSKLQELGYSALTTLISHLIKTHV